MPADAFRLLGQLPSVRGFVHQAVADLKEGISAVVLVNRALERKALEDLCAAELVAADAMIEQIDLALAGSEDTPFELLRRILLPDAAACQRCPGIYQLLREDALPETIILRNLPAAARQRAAWLSFINEWAEAAHSLGSTSRRRPLALLVCMNLATSAGGGEQTPAENPRLHLYWWWSVMTALEIRLLLRLRHPPGDSDHHAQRTWREFLLPALAGSDAEMADALWDPVLSDFDTLLARLCTVAAKRGWSAKLLHDLELDRYRPRRGVPAANRQLPGGMECKLWSRGLLEHIDELGIVVSSAALAVLDDTEAIRHRIWRGQAALVLPLLDELRLIICRDLNRSHGNLWITQWMNLEREQANEMVANPFSAEWGQLETCLSRAPMAAQRWLPAVQQARSVRNRLAHYQSISFADYTLLLHYLG